METSKYALFVVGNTEGIVEAVTILFNRFAGPGALAGCVIRITPRQAVVAILICGDTVLDAEWQGLIRAQDVRATEKDRVKVYESFRPGDIVRAEVVSYTRVILCGLQGVLLTMFTCADFAR